MLIGKLCQALCVIKIFLTPHAKIQVNRIRHARFNGPSDNRNNWGDTSTTTNAKNRAFMLLAQISGAQRATDPEGGSDLKLIEDVFSDDE